MITASGSLQEALLESAAQRDGPFDQPRNLILQFGAAHQLASKAGGLFPRQFQKRLAPGAKIGDHPPSLAQGAGVACRRCQAQTLLAHEAVAPADAPAAPAQDRGRHHLLAVQHDHPVHRANELLAARSPAHRPWNRQALQRLGRQFPAAGTRRSAPAAFRGKPATLPWGCAAYAASRARSRRTRRRPVRRGSIARRHRAQPPAADRASLRPARAASPPACWPRGPGAVAKHRIRPLRMPGRPLSDRCKRPRGSSAPGPARASAATLPRRPRPENPKQPSRNYRPASWSSGKSIASREAT